jgi:hypothetical protein
MYDERRVQPKYLWFRFSIALGLGLGLLLLVQTIRTYREVADGLLQHEAQREVDRRMQSISRAARLTRSRDPATLTPVLHELVHESPKELAWIRIINRQGKVIAESEKVTGAPVYTLRELGRVMQNPERHTQEKTDAVGRGGDHAESVAARPAAIRPAAGRPGVAYRRHATGSRRT